jgi:hypothetical protein
MCPNIGGIVKPVHPVIEQQIENYATDKATVTDLRKV